MSNESHGARVGRRTAVLLGAAVTVSAMLPAGASAERWRGTTLTYRNVTPWQRSVDQAVSWINQLPGPVQLRRAQRGHRAQITLRAVSRPDVDWAGLAWTTTYRGRIIGARIELNRSWYEGDGAGIDRRTARAEVTVHELLHAIGLPHDSGCSVMQAVGGDLGEAPCSDGAPEGQVACGPQRRDAAAVVARYGGSVGTFDGFRCDDPFWERDDCSFDADGWCEDGESLRARRVD